MKLNEIYPKNNLEIVINKNNKHGIIGNMFVINNTCETDEYTTEHRYILVYVKDNMQYYLSWPKNRNLVEIFKNSFYDPCAIIAVKDWNSPSGTNKTIWQKNVYSKQDIAKMLNIDEWEFDLDANL